MLTFNITILGISHLVSILRINLYTELCARAPITETNKCRTDMSTCGARVMRTKRSVEKLSFKLQICIAASKYVAKNCTNFGLFSNLACKFLLWSIWNNQIFIHHFYLFCCSEFHNYLSKCIVYTKARKKSWLQKMRA